MKRNEYLKKALAAGLVDKLAWLYSAFAIVQEAAESYKKDPYPFRIISQHSRYQFIDEKGEIVDIEDSSTKEPLFRFKEEINIDSSWASNIKEVTNTKIGNLIFNSVVITPVFKKKFPFQAGKLNLGDIEKYIASRLQDNIPVTDRDESDPGKIYVDEYLHFRDNLVYLEQLAPLTNWSATRKGITKSPELASFKKKLLQEYEGRLNDPAIFAEYESKLKAFDKEWLKDDPAFGTFLKGKVLGVSRKKLFLGIGIPERLDTKTPVVPIIQSLEEGQPTDPEKLSAVINGARFGSFSRGAETVNGGVVSKTVIRIGSNFVVDMQDCGTQFGIEKTFNSDTIHTLIGRVVVEKSKSVLIEKIEQAKYYLDRPVIIRTPATCQAGPGDRLCLVCSGNALSQHKEGLAIPFTEVSHLILNQSLKAMHGTELSTALVDLEKVLT